MARRDATVSSSMVSVQVCRAEEGRFHRGCRPPIAPRRPPCRCRTPCGYIRWSRLPHRPTTCCWWRGTDERTERYAVEEHCNTFKLPAVRREYDRLARQARAESWSYEEYLRELLDAEVRARDASKHRALAKMPGCAKHGSPTSRPLARLSLQATDPRIGNLSVRRTARGRGHRRADRHRNRTWSSPSPTTLSRTCFTARFVTAAVLIESLSVASRHGRLQEQLAHYLQPHVLVLDEVGCLSYRPDTANVLFQIVNERHQRGRPSLFTTNKHPLTAWGNILHDHDLSRGHRRPCRRERSPAAARRPFISH